MKRAKRKTSSAPSASYFLGYVEEDETPDAIMKKFEELENFQRQNAIGKNAQMSEEQLKELFARTSSFTVQSATEDFYDWEHLFDEEQESDARQEDDFESASEQEAFGACSAADEIEDEDSFEEKPAINAMASVIDQSVSNVVQRSSKPKKQTEPFSFTQIVQRPSAKPKSQPGDIAVLKLPQPITANWAHLICERGSPNSADRLVASASSVNPKSIFACLIDFDDDLQLLNALNVDAFIERGFLCIWAQKTNIPAIVKFAAKWNFKYCENICWIKMTVGHRFHVAPAEFFSTAKCTLLIFRRFKDDEMELRHQRNTDCIFDFVKPAGCYSKPSSVFGILETLLPVDEERVAFLHFVPRKMLDAAVETCQYPTACRWRIVCL